MQMSSEGSTGHSHESLLAYINDLLDSLISSDARIFADDSLLNRTVNGAKDNTTPGIPCSYRRVGASLADEFQPAEVFCHTCRCREKKGLPLFI